MLRATELWKWNWNLTYGPEGKKWLVAQKIDSAKESIGANNLGGNYWWRKDLGKYWWWRERTDWCPIIKAVHALLLETTVFISTTFICATRHLWSVLLPHNKCLSRSIVQLKFLTWSFVPLVIVAPIFSAASHICRELDFCKQPTLHYQSFAPPVTYCPMGHKYF